MNNDAVFTKIQLLLSESFQLPVADITPDLSFGDIPQWDSIGHMDLMMRLEELYGIEITADTIGELTSVPAICACLEK
ncbi:MAG: acyl carrier protein [Chloroflexota bacterium]|jgi:acyl carrier protein